MSGRGTKGQKHKRKTQIDIEGEKTKVDQNKTNIIHESS
jgi:hypothetical protein